MILLTGATGYIGSHVWVELLNDSSPVIGIDNLSNSKIECLDAISKISGKSPIFQQGDIRDINFLDEIFSKHQITHVIHLAALKDVHDSMLNHDKYLDVNVNGLKTLLATMRMHHCLKILFSSSAAVYGDMAISPIKESADRCPTNWYGETKLKAENLLLEEAFNQPPLTSVSLRYFNVAGRHSSGFLGDYSSSESSSLFCQIERVFRSKGECLPIFGDSWETPDGTCIRDYVHISDIAKGHKAALRLLDSLEGFNPVNLGSGEGKSVKQVLSAFQEAVKYPLPTKIEPKRVGDVPISYSDCSKAADLMGWKPSHNLLDICHDQIR